MLEYLLTSVTYLDFLSDELRAGSDRIPILQLIELGSVDFYFGLVFAAIAQCCHLRDCWKSSHNYLEYFNWIKFYQLASFNMNRNLDKLKQFFRSNKINSAQERIYVLNNEIERELRDSSNEKRVKIIKELGEIVQANRLEEVRNSSRLSVHFSLLAAFL
jgi:hypothetical protein